LTVTCPPIEAQRRIGALFRYRWQISAHWQMFEEAAAAVRVKVASAWSTGHYSFDRVRFRSELADGWAMITPTMAAVVPGEALSCLVDGLYWPCLRGFRTFRLTRFCL
jgi:hypothetical protein